MAEGMDEAAGLFAREVAPASEPRDQAGKLVQVPEHPEPLFSERRVEGDEFTGDTRDGGDDERYRAREREVADGWSEERDQRRAAKNAQNLRRAESDAEESGGDDDDQTDIAPVDGSDAEEGDEDEGPRYEVTVDGAVHEVTLKEALRGYVRTATFHQRASQLNQFQSELDAEYHRQQSNWGLLIKARRDYEDDLANLTPSEPNWDQEYARDPYNAHATHRIYQTIYNKLNYSRSYRAQMEAYRASESDRRVQKFAVDGFSKFVMDNRIPDEPTLKREIRSMRRTAEAVGFNEYEIATVYDPRMLTILRKASKYDRMMAAQPRAVIPGKGKTLTPGAATPLGNVRRSGFDEAQRRLAQSGKLSDAADVFRRLL